MQKQNVDFLINEADQLMNSAEQELQRSEEDVTAYMICNNSRQSMINYLAAFLLKHGVELKQPVSMASLMEQCRKMDGRFDLIDITHIYCRHDEDSEEYCLNIEKVNDCLRIAKQIRGFATSEAPAH